MFGAKFPLQHVFPEPKICLLLLLRWSGENTIFWLLTLQVMNIYYHGGMLLRSRHWVWYRWPLIPPFQEQGSVLSYLMDYICLRRTSRIHYWFGGRLQAFLLSCFPYAHLTPSLRRCHLIKLVLIVGWLWPCPSSMLGHTKKVVGSLGELWMSIVSFMANRNKNEVLGKLFLYMHFTSVEITL